MSRGFIVLLHVVVLALGIFLGGIKVSAASSLPPEPGESEERGGATSLYGYGELHFNAPKGGDSKMDFHRFVIGVAHEFNDWISLHSEVDLEHGFAEPYLEYAYLDFALNPALNIRAGSVLLPMGFINETHEPPVFFSVERPDVDARIIPTTWTEGGGGILGSPFPGFNYRLYLVSGLNALGDSKVAKQFCKDGFTADKGVRGGRCKAADGLAEDLAVVGRLEYAGLPGLKLGLSAYRGGADQGKIPDAEVVVTMWDIDAQLRFAGLDIQGIYVQTRIDDAEKINNSDADSSTAGIQPRFTGNKSIGEEMFGWYVVLGYHLAAWMPNGQDLVPFVRYEQLDTQDKVPSGFSKNPANELKIITSGLAYYPHERVAVKGDYQTREDGSDKRTRQFNLGVAYMF